MSGTLAKLHLEEDIKLASQLAEGVWNHGKGPLPPGWKDAVSTKQRPGQTYYIKPDGTTTWEDPRRFIDNYKNEYISAARAGWDFTTKPPTPPIRGGGAGAPSTDRKSVV